MFIYFSLIALMSAPTIMAMESLNSNPLNQARDRQDSQEFDQELLNLSLSPRDKELANGPRSPIKTPVSSPRVASLSSPRRLSLTNLLKVRKDSLERTLSSPKLDRPKSPSPRPGTSPFRKRLSSSKISGLQREKILILPPRCVKRQPISGEEDQDDFKMVVFNVRSRVCSDALMKKREFLRLARHSDNQDLIAKLQPEVDELETQTLQFAQEQRNWLVDIMLDDGISPREK